MSVREDLIIQADDVTIVQGDKVKDYNVIVTSQDGNPLSDVPVTIAFYNNDYSFVNDVITNEYGVASVPLYLGGDAWFVDVHFKGDSDYKPQIVTKEINIEKFEILDTYIKSENLVINIDEISMDGTYYTITLLDSYDRPVADEPVSIVVQQTGVDDPQTYIDMVLKTDKDGIIKVPFLSHDENVQITTHYYGCTRYKPCLNADIVSFEDVEPRNDVEFRYRAYDYGHHELSWRINGGDWGVIQESDWNIVYPYINLENDNRNVYDGWFYVTSLKQGTYKLTLCYEGALENTYPFCRTFIYEEPNDNRKDLSDWIEFQGGSDDVNVIVSSDKLGDLAHIKFEFNYVLPYTVTTLTLQGGGGAYFTVPQYEYASDESWQMKTILEFDVILYSYQSSDSIRVTIDQNYHSENQFIKKDGSAYFDYYDGNIPIGEHIGGDLSILTVNGFGANSETYQSIDVVADKPNEYYIMNVINKDTLEEFYFYSYLIDEFTPVRNNFTLAMGTWDYTIVSKPVFGYSGGSTSGNATISVNSEINPPTQTIIANSENYIDLGTDSPTFVDDTITTATTDDDIHSIMALEFTNSNYYRLSFNAEVTGDTTIIYGADPTLTTMDGLFINTNEITLYNDDIEMDKLIFDTPLFNQANNNVLFQRYGNQFTIFVNDVQVYKTELLSWNTFGVYQNVTGSEIELSHFVLEPYITTEITPSVADYDGTIFGSNIHLEIDDNKLNLIDYGMLPQGAIGSGKVILNDVPLESANNYAIQLEMKYNNSRFERLNNLTGQMQMRVYEDMLSSDTVKDYEKTLCSPMPVPNSRTVFTRHSDEGTLYFVQDPLNANSSFLTNAYNQYKGGCSITSETGIYLSNLDNAHSPVFVGNELVRAEFHRRSGFIRLARYDETSGDWVNVNTLKLRNYPQLSLNKYNDDYAEVQFGNTVWKFYRGRPFIVLNHSKDDLKIMNLVDRVYCETVENQRGMGFIVDQNPNEQTTVTDENGVVLGNYSTFNPQLSIQQFKQELHIGENIRLDNFELYEDEYSLKEKSTIFEDACTSNDNKSSGYFLGNGSYSFDNDGLTIDASTYESDIYKAHLRLDNNVYTVPFEVSFDLINDGNDNFRCYFHNTSFSNSAIASGSLWTNPSGQTTKIRFVVTHNGIKRYIGNNEVSLSLSQNVADNMGVRFGYWQTTQSNIKIKNYKVTQLEYINNIGEVTTDSQMGITQIDNDNALVIVKEDNPLALNFPSYSHYVERVNDTFTLSIDYLDCPFDTIQIKARGFDDKGAVPVKDNIQYGIWEQTVTVEVDTTATDSVRATFTNCPSEVKYIDFIIYFTGANSTDIIMKDLMYYDGDAILNHDVDTSRLYAEQVEVQFADTYFANIYNDKDNCGLCIARPYQEPFTLTSLKASSETVLIPYMKKATEWDKPQQVFLEYLNAKQQVIDIDWEN